MKKFKIGLKDNGIHSLNKGLKMFDLYEEDKDDFQLKESIMFLHHGIELLMKQVLIENAGEYLIYSDISDVTVKKVIKAKKDGIGVFDLDRPPHTSTYLEVIGRAKAFVDNPELEESLETRLKELNKIRNKLEHYAIDIEIKKIENLILKIRKPLLKYLKDSLKDFEKNDYEEIEENWEKISENERIENEVFELLQKVNGQKVPGELLGTTGIIQLPNFKELIKHYPLKIGRRRKRRWVIDILAKDDLSKNWIIEVKTKNRSSSAIDQVLDYVSIIEGTPWIIIFNSIPQELKVQAKENGIFITNMVEWNKLKELLLK